MSMDHDYAKEKLTLLLRDLPAYTGDEFWRQMSRIAAGATGLESAEALRRENGDLRSANRQRQERLEENERTIVRLNKEVASIPMREAEAIRRAADHTRKEMVEGGLKWLCSVSDLRAYSDQIERQS